MIHSLIHSFIYLWHYHTPITLQVICHGIPDYRELQDGDIVNIDVRWYTLTYPFWHTHSLRPPSYTPFLDHPLTHPFTYPLTHPSDTHIHSHTFLIHSRSYMYTYIHTPTHILLPPINISVYYNGFHGDLNETFFVGNVDKSSEKIVEVAFHALQAAIATVKPGTLYRDKSSKMFDCYIILWSWYWSIVSYSSECTTLSW